MNTTLGTKPVAVMGADIDPDTAKGLTSGDKVLVEVNGERLFGHGDNPILADIPWTVERNFPPQDRVQKKHKLVLSHPFHSSRLILHYENMKSQRGPAVFAETDATISSTPSGEPLPIYVILQLVSHYMPASAAKESFHNVFHPSFLDDPQFRRQVISGIVSATGKLEAGGWRYTSKCRFALRSGVRMSHLDLIASKDIDFLAAMDDDTVAKLGREFGWMDSFKVATSILVETGTAIKPTETHNDRFIDNNIGYDCPTQ